MKIFKGIMSSLITVILIPIIIVFITYLATRSIVSKQGVNDLFNRFNLETFFLSIEERRIRYLTSELKKTKKAFKDINKILNNTSNEFEKMKGVIRTLRNLNGKYIIQEHIVLDFNENIDFNEIENIMIKRIEKEIENLQQEK